MIMMTSTTNTAVVWALLLDLIMEDSSSVCIDSALLTQTAVRVVCIGVCAYQMHGISIDKPKNIW